MIALFIILLLGLPFGMLAYYTAIPASFPRNIPAVPIWLQIYDAFRGLSRVENYNTRIRPLIEKYGAVALWRHGQWTVLTTKPAYLVQLFKKTDGVLSKAGAYHRLPGSLNAKFFGENIFNSDQELHSAFAKILRPGMLRPVPIASIKSSTAELATRLLQEQTSPRSGMGIRALVWTWSVSLYGEYFLDKKIDLLEFRRSSMQQILRSLNRSIVGRLDFLFPLLRHVLWKPHIIQKTGVLLRELELDLMDEVEHRRTTPPSPLGADKIIHLLGKARDDGQISEFHYRSNHKQLYVAGHENTEAALASILLQLAEHKDIQGRLRSAVVQEIPHEYTVEDLDRLPLLLAVIYETLRLYPPLWTLTNRKSLETVMLEPDITIPADTFVGWHAYGIHTDPSVWGESSRRFDPLRWGADCAAVSREVRVRQARGEYIPFGLHSRRCLGSGFALTALKVTLCELLRSIEWNLPTDYTPGFSNTPVMRPDDCNLVVRKRNAD